MATKERFLRFSILVYRKPSLSEEEFSNHWRTQHAPIVRDWLSRHGVLNTTRRPTSATLPASSPAILQTAYIADYDGCVELLVRDFDCLVRAREDPYYKETVAPDEEKFFDMARSQMTVGWEEVYLQDGKVVNVKPGEANVIMG